MLLYYIQHERRKVITELLYIDDNLSINITEALCDFQYCSDETRLFSNFDILIPEKV